MRYRQPAKKLRALGCEELRWRLPFVPTTALKDRVWGKPVSDGALAGSIRKLWKNDQHTISDFGREYQLHPTEKLVGRPASVFAGFLTRRGQWNQR
jgi:hypothetical protein